MCPSREYVATLNAHNGSVNSLALQDGQEWLCMERNTPPRPAKPGLKISAENISLMQKHAKGCGEVAEKVARELGIPWLRLDFFLPDNGGEAVFNEFGFQRYTSRAAFFTVSYEFCIWACRIKGPPFFKQRKIQALPGKELRAAKFLQGLWNSHRILM